MRRPFALTLSILLLGTVVSSPAFAEPSAAEKALARSLFEQGRAFAKDGKWAEACPKFEESERLDHGIGTLFNLADCYEHVGRTASAWTGFSEVADLAKRSGQPERQTIATTRAAALATKLSKIRIHVASPIPPGIDIKLDDKSIGAIAIDADIPIDPGNHKVVATAPQKIAVAKDIVVAATPGTIPIDLPALEDQPKPGVEPPNPPPRPLERPAESGGTWHKPVALGLGITGLVAVGVGSFFGLQASSKWSDAEAACPANRCTEEGYAGWEDAKQSAFISNIGFAAGGALLLSAAVLWILAPSAPAARTTGTR